MNSHSSAQFYASQQPRQDQTTSFFGQATPASQSQFSAPGFYAEQSSMPISQPNVHQHKAQYKNVGYGDGAQASTPYQRPNQYQNQTSYPATTPTESYYAMGAAIHDAYVPHYGVALMKLLYGDDDAMYKIGYYDGRMSKKSSCCSKCSGSCRRSLKSSESGRGRSLSPRSPVSVPRNVVNTTVATPPLPPTLENAEIEVIEPKGDEPEVIVAAKPVQVEVKAATPPPVVKAGWGNFAAHIAQDDERQRDQNKFDAIAHKGCRPAMVETYQKDKKQKFETKYEKIGEAKKA